MDNIKDYTLKDLSQWFVEQGEAPFRARQVFRWLYQRQMSDFSQMSDLSLGLRRKIAQYFHSGEVHREAVAASADGSLKYIFRLKDGQKIETVLMPNRTHHTLCVSTQVGCAMGCRFCNTAQMGLVRNLEVGEIIQQVVEASKDVPAPSFVRNIVFMGMGEPLHNYDNLCSALRILTEDYAFGLSWRRLTVSSAGLVSGLLRLAEEDTLRPNVAISLNGVTDTERGSLMPINQRWNIATLLEACRKLPQKGYTRLTFEYILLAGITDRLEHAAKLVKLLHGLRCKVNLIPFNSWPGATYQGPDMAHARHFQRVLLDKGLLTTLRLSKGRDVQGACGQLVAEGRRKITTQPA